MMLMFPNYVKMGEPSEEELAQIEKFKKNGWI